MFFSKWLTWLANSDKWKAPWAAFSVSVFSKTPELLPRWSEQLSSKMKVFCHLGSTWQFHVLATCQRQILERIKMLSRSGYKYTATTSSSQYRVVAVGIATTRIQKCALFLSKIPPERTLAFMSVGRIIRWLVQGIQSVWILEVSPSGRRSLNYCILNKTGGDYLLNFVRNAFDIAFLLWNPQNRKH